MAAETTVEERPKGLGQSFNLEAFKAMESKALQKGRTADKLLSKPRARHQYVTDTGLLTFCDKRFEPKSQRPVVRQHPRVTAAKRSHNLTGRLERWYKYIDPEINLPIAGIYKDAREKELQNGESAPDGCAAVSASPKWKSSSYLSCRSYLRHIPSGQIRHSIVYNFFFVTVQRPTYFVSFIDERLPANL